MELTEYAATCFSPITEEIYDQLQFISLTVHKYMKLKHAGVHSTTIKAVCYDVFMHYFETLHDDASLTLEERPEEPDINEWAENAYCDLKGD